MNSQIKLAQELFDLLEQNKSTQDNLLDIYNKGRTDQKHEDEDNLLVLTKSEIKTIRTQAINDCIAVVNEYDSTEILKRLERLK